MKEFHLFEIEGKKQKRKKEKKQEIEKSRKLQKWRNRKIQQNWFSRRSRARVGPVSMSVTCLSWSRAIFFFPFFYFLFFFHFQFSNAKNFVWIFHLWRKNSTFLIGKSNQWFAIGVQIWLKFPVRPISYIGENKSNFIHLHNYCTWTSAWICRNIKSVWNFPINLCA